MFSSVVDLGKIIWQEFEFKTLYINLLTTENTWYLHRILEDDPGLTLTLKINENSLVLNLGILKRNPSIIS